MKKILPLLFTIFFAISCVKLEPNKIGLIFDVYGGRDEDYTSSATFGVIYKEDYFYADTREYKIKKIAKYGDSILSQSVRYQENYDANVYPESKIIVEIFPSEAHNIKSVSYDNIEQVVKNNKLEIVVDEYKGNMAFYF